MYKDPRKQSVGNDPTEVPDPWQDVQFLESNGKP
jgi:hypothetical protein